MYAPKENNKQVEEYFKVTFIKKMPLLFSIVDLDMDIGIDVVLNFSNVQLN